MPLPPRLVPVNAVLALLTANTGWPSDLFDRGYRLAGLEVPASTKHSTTRLDAVAARGVSNHVVVAECKGGGNVDLDQADKLNALDADGIVRTASIDLQSAAPVTLDVVYVCMDEHAERIVTALESNETPFPVLSISGSELRHLGAPFTSDTLSDVLVGTIAVSGPPPAILRFDDQTPVEEFVPVVRAELVAEQSHRREIITVPTLTERVVPQYAYLGKTVKGAVTRRVEAACKRISRDLPDDFQFRPPTGEFAEPAVKILRSPEDHDTRGRTQGYQRLARIARKGPPRPKPPLPGHLRLFEELDDVVTDDETSEEGEA